MTEYISREALPAKRERGFFQDDAFNAGWNACLEKISKLPAADVVEVKRGEWRICEEHTSISKTRGRETHVTTWKCSNCFATNGRRKSNFCPNCGAKMEEQT